MQRPIFTPHIARPAELFAPQGYRPTVLADPQSAAFNSLGLFPSQLRAWWDASDASTVTLASGDVVTAWADKSGNGYTVSQATGSKQPAYAAASVNGLNAILFDDAASQVLTGVGPIASREVYVWAVASSNDATVAQVVFAQLEANPAVGTGPYLSTLFRGDGAGDPVQIGEYNGTTPTSATTATGYTANTPALLTARFTSATSRGVSLNGGTEAANATSVDGLTGTDRATIGGFFNTASSSSYFSGYVCEIVVAVGVSVTQAANLNAALIAKWGIA